MKHIKLFEAFTNDAVTDYRVSYVEPDMKEGYYLFSTVEPGSYDSIFGVFDLKGLKELEDSINTEIIVKDLLSKVQDVGNRYNPEEEFDNYTITPISKKSKFMRVSEEEGLEWEITWNKDDVEKDLGLFGISIYDLPDVELGTIKLKDLPFGSYLSRHIISIGLVLLPSKTEGDEEHFMNIPIVLNQCHFMDYHGTLISGSPSSSISDQMTKTFGETEMDLFERIADLNNIEKYLPKIFDSDVPDGFIKILNRLKSSGGDPSENLKRFKKEFEKLQNIDFEQAMDSAEKSYERMIPSIPPPRQGDSKDLERYKKEYNEAQIRFNKEMSQEIKDHTNDVLLDMQNLINKYKGIVKGYSFKDEQDFIDYHIDIQDRGIKGLPPKNWPSGRKWPATLL